MLEVEARTRVFTPRVPGARITGSGNYLTARSPVFPSGPIARSASTGQE